MISGVRKANDVVLLINPKEYTYLLVLAIVSTQWYFWRISSFQCTQLLTSEVFWKFLLQVIVLLTSEGCIHLDWGCMHKSCGVWKFPSSCSQVKASMHSPRKHQASTESLIRMMEIPLLITVIPHGSNTVGIQALLVVITILYELVRIEYLRWKFRLAPIQILNVRMWFEYLRWKFKLSLTHLWSGKCLLD